MRAITVLLTAIIAVGLLATAGGFLLMLTLGIVWHEFAVGAPLAYGPAVGLYTVGSLLINALRAKGQATFEREANK